MFSSAAVWPNKDKECGVIDDIASVPGSAGRLPETSSTVPLDAIQVPD
jgi:hypothetical protein